MPNKYYVYILECADCSYYTGMTNNLERRLAEHEAGLDTTAYTFTRRPLQLRWYETFLSPNAAIDVEKQLKGWNRKKKEALMTGNYDLLPELAKSRTT